MLRGRMGQYIFGSFPLQHVDTCSRLDPFWTGAFFAISAFNNSGMALLDANAVAVNNSY